MEENRDRKQELRDTISRKIGELEPNELAARNKALENRLFEFANYLESRIALLYLPVDVEVDTAEIVRRSYLYNKIIVLPAFKHESRKMVLMKVDDPNRDLVTGPRGNLEPNPARCKAVPIDSLDIAIIPAIAMDEKGARLGTGRGYYDRLMPELPLTTRKVGLVYEAQILPSIPIESHDKHVDIVVTEKRIIYRI